MPNFFKQDMAIFFAESGESTYSSGPFKSSMNHEIYRVDGGELHGNVATRPTGLA